MTPISKIVVTSSKLAIDQKCPFLYLYNPPINGNANRNRKAEGENKG